MTWHNDSTATNTSLLSKWTYAVLRPIVRILRSAGVAESTLLDCVERASAQYEGEVLKGRLGSGSSYESVITIASVTSAWARLPEWTDEAGNPRDLVIRQSDPKGFATLVRSIDSRLDASAVLAELKAVGVVRTVNNETAARLLRSSVVHTSERTFSVETVLRDVQRFAETLEHNIFRDRQLHVGRTQLTAARLSIDPTKYEDFARFMARHGQGLLDAADDRLNSYRDVPDGAGANYGVGLFVFLEPPLPGDLDASRTGSGQKLARAPD